MLLQCISKILFTNNIEKGQYFKGRTPITYMLVYIASFLFYKQSRKSRAKFGLIFLRIYSTDRLFLLFFIYSHFFKVNLAITVSFFNPFKTKN